MSIRQSSHLGVFPLWKATQRLVPNSGNKGYVSNPISFHRKTEMFGHMKTLNMLICLPADIMAS